MKKFIYGSKRKVHLGEQGNIGQQCATCLSDEESKVLEYLHQNKSVAVGIFIDKLIIPHFMIMEASHMTQCRILGKLRYTWGPNFKVVLEC